MAVDTGRYRRAVAEFGRRERERVAREFVEKRRLLQAGKKRAARRARYRLVFAERGGKKAPISGAEARKEWAGRNRDKVNRNAATWRRKNPGYMKRYYAENKEKIRATRKAVVDRYGYCKLCGQRVKKREAGDGKAV